MLAYSITISCPTSDAPNAYKLPRETFFLLSNKYLLESEAHPWIEWSMCLQPGCSRVGVKYSRQLVPMCYMVARHHIFEQQWKLLCHLELQSLSLIFVTNIVRWEAQLTQIPLDVVNWDQSPNQVRVALSFKVTRHTWATALVCLHFSRWLWWDLTVS